MDQHCIHNTLNETHELLLSESQVSLRDKLAMAAMQGLLTTTTTNGRYVSSFGKTLAEDAYKMADYMLVERDKKRDDQKPPKEGVYR